MFLIRLVGRAPRSNRESNGMLMPSALRSERFASSLHESIASLDLLYWAAHRSSSLVPDYVSFKMEGVRVISKLNRSASFRAINVVVDALRERFDVDGMPLTSHRHWSMLKLMRSLSEFAVGEGILRQRHYDAIFKKA